MTLTQTDLQAISKLIEPVQSDIQGMRSEMQDMRRDIQDLVKRLTSLEDYMENTADKNILKLAENQCEIWNELNPLTGTPQMDRVLEVMISDLEYRVRRLESNTHITITPKS